MTYRRSTLCNAIATVWGCCIAAAALFPAQPARAHDPAEGIGLVFADQKADTVPLIVSNRGLVFEEPGSSGARYTLRCNDGYMASSTDRPGVFFGEGGALVVGVPYHVLTTHDRGCTAQEGTGFGTDPTTNVVGHPSAPQRLFLATRTYKTPSTLFVSEDYGRTFTKRFETVVGTFFDGLMIAPSDAQRMIAPAVSFDTVNVLVNYFCARSDDGGHNWTMQPLGTNKIVPFAVHPKLPDVVFAYQPMDKLETTYRVLRSADGGAHFSTVLENVVKPTDIAATGQHTWLGIGGNGGLYRSSDDGQHFEQVLKDMVQSVTCALERQGRLWLCMNMAPNQNGIWYSDDEAATLHKLMSFEQVTQPVLCEANLALCAGNWYDFDREVRPPEDDAGSTQSDAGVDAPDAELSADDAGATEEDASDAPLDAGDKGEITPPKRDKGCQLSTEPEQRRLGALALFGFASLLCARRRRRVTAS